MDLRCPARSICLSVRETVGEPASETVGNAREPKIYLEAEHGLAKMCRVIQIINFNFNSALTLELRHIDQSKTFK
jgi:hypothetical protein